MPALSPAQLAALRSRAEETDACGRFGQGIRDATGPLSEFLATLAGDHRALAYALRDLIIDGPPEGDAEYRDGWAGVLDDMRGVLDNDPVAIANLTDIKEG